MMKTPKMPKGKGKSKNPAIKKSGPVKSGGTANKLNDKMWRGMPKGK